MKIIFALLIIIFLAFSGYHLTFRGFKLPLFAQKMYLTGTEFLFLGLLLGPYFLNLLDSSTITGLEPLSALLLSWVGLLFGFQFEISKLRRFPFSFFIASLLEGVSTFLIVFIGVYFVFPLVVELSLKIRVTIALTLGVAAACTAQTGLALFGTEAVELKRKTLRLLGYISSIDGLSAMLIFSIVFFFLPSAVSDIPWMIKSNFGTAAGMAASIGLIFLYLLFLSHRMEEKELILIVIGMAVLTSGAASVLHFSPLLANFFIGFCLVNFSKEKERIFNILVSVEKPVYLLILVFLGANWQVTSGADRHFEFLVFIILAVGYCLCRFLGKLLGGYLVTRINRELKQYPRLLGFGLIDQGGLPLAILFDFQQGFPNEIANFAVSIALLAIIINGLISPHFFQKLLRSD